MNEMTQAKATAQTALGCLNGLAAEPPDMPLTCCSVLRRTGSRWPVRASIAGRAAASAARSSGLSRASMVASRSARAARRRASRAEPSAVMLDLDHPPVARVRGAGDQPRVQQPGDELGHGGLGHALVHRQQRQPGRPGPVQRGQRRRRGERQPVPRGQRAQQGQQPLDPGRHLQRQLVLSPSQLASATSPASAGPPSPRAARPPVPGRPRAPGRPSPAPVRPAAASVDRSISYLYHLIMFLPSGDLARTRAAARPEIKRLPPRLTIKELAVAPRTPAPLPRNTASRGVIVMLRLRSIPRNA